MQQKLMRVRVRCVAADSIYANNANRKFCTKYGISTSFVRKGRAAKDEPLRKILRKRKGHPAGRQLRHSEATLLALKDKGQKQEDGNTVDFLWNTYGKCHTDDRKNQKQNS